MRGGTLARLGLGSDRIRATNPGVVYASSQGYGASGPMATTPGWGQLNSCFSGVHYLWNHPDAPYPCGTSLNHPDHIAGKWLALLVLAALARRHRTGRGCDIELAHAFLIGDAFIDLSRTGVDPEPAGNAAARAVPHGVYPAAGDDEWVAIECEDDIAFERLAVALELVDEPDWRHLGGRIAARDKIDAAVSAWTSSFPGSVVADRLQRVGVSAMPVMGPADHRNDTHLATRGFLVDIDNPHVGTELHVGNPMRCRDLRLRTAGAAPAIGQHTIDILTSLLGRTLDEAEHLVDAGICR
jgi:benzylsuccinate CoA-transferase BbsF subunit